MGCGRACGGNEGKEQKEPNVRAPSPTRSVNAEASPRRKIDVWVTGTPAIDCGGWLLDAFADLIEDSSAHAVVIDVLS